MRPSKTRRAPTRTYRRHDELRQLMLDASVELALRDGFTATPRVSLTGALQHLRARGHRVAIGSVLGSNRVWACQRDFQMDVTIELLRRFGHFSVGASVIGPAIERARVTADLRTKSSRRQALRAFLRDVGHDYYAAATGRSDWTLWLAIRATIGAQPVDARASAIREHINEGHERILATLIEHAYTPLLDTFRLRLRAEYAPDGMVHFAAATMLLSAGFALTIGSRHLLVTRQGPAGLESWNLLGLSLEALIHEFFEAR